MAVYLTMKKLKENEQVVIYDFGPDDLHRYKITYNKNTESVITDEEVSSKFCTRQAGNSTNSKNC